MLRWISVFLAAASVLAGLPASAQRPGAVRVLAVADLPASFDTTEVERYLASIATEIGRIAPHHRQLADWNRPKGIAWDSPGLRRTRTELEYGHSLTRVRNRGLNGQFGAEGFRLYVYAYSARHFRTLSGVSVGTVLFGAPLGGGCVVANVYSTKPRVPELEEAIAGILRQGLAAESHCTGPFDEPAYIELAKSAPLRAIDSTGADLPFGRWVAEVAGDSSRIVWETDDCGEGGDGREAPTCVTASVALRGGGSALVSVIVADLKGAPSTPRFWSVYLRESPNVAYDDLKTLGTWAAAVRARLP